MTLDEIQLEQTAWSTRNFGAQPAHRPLLGIIEELAELEEALLAEDDDLAGKDAVVDAIGDVSIYMLDYCGKRGWRMQDVWDARCALPGYEEFIFGPSNDGSPYLYPFIKVLAHSQLKGEQDIRGGKAVHDENLKAMLSNVLWMLAETAKSYYELDVLVILETVWNKVKQRNWVANPNTAHTVAEQVIQTKDLAVSTDP